MFVSLFKQKSPTTFSSIQTQNMDRELFLTVSIRVHAWYDWKNNSICQHMLTSSFSTVLIDSHLLLNLFMILNLASNIFLSNTRLVML